MATAHLIRTIYQGLSLIDRLSREAKSSSKFLSVEVISGVDGAKAILKHLDESNRVDEIDQMDIDLSSFLDFTWRGNVPVKQLITWCHSRIDKLAELNIDEKLNGHLLLRAAGLDTQLRNLIAGASAGSYKISCISVSFRQAFRDRPKPYAITTSPEHIDSKS